MKYSLTSDFLERELTGVVSGTTVHLSNDVSMTFEHDENDQAALYLTRNGVRRRVVIANDEDTTVKLSVNGYSYSVDALSERDAHFQNLLKQTATATSSSMKVVAPMPGLLKSVNVKPGQMVKKGERLFILEAMKMENDIKAPMAGVIGNLHATPGTAVEKNFLLCMIDAAPQGE
ncbi:MAG: biotin/lipoyl-binding protein [Candidatus Kapabacteria bacterium]|jgi:biotin carboxyl carrier protein|nr:biotin/lipoyl-binding protein [Candidatus Kapabacteria bacterium]